MIEKYEGAKVIFFKISLLRAKKFSAKNFFDDSQSACSRRRILRREFFWLSAKKFFT
jgi:hypothetical protein